MADHKAEQILNAVLSKLTAAAVPSAVTIGRDHPYTYDDSELPAVNITMGTDKAKQYLLGQQVLNDMDIEIEVVAKTSAVLSTTINEIRKEISVALRADYTLGLAFMVELLPTEMAKPEQKDGDLPVMGCTTTWLATYQASINDPSA